MSDPIAAYAAWVRDTREIWAFERDDNPVDAGPKTLREIQSAVMQALTAIPNYIHPEAAIDDGATLRGPLIVEEGAQILGNVTIQGPAFIGRNAVVGNYTFLRGYCFLSRDSLVGNHCYCNDVAIGRSVRVGHFVNISRTLVCYNSSLSAFVLTATTKADKSAVVAEPGKVAAKLGATIGANTFVAPHTVLVPGVSIGHRSFVGSFFLVNESVPDDTFIENKREVHSKPNTVRIPRRSKVSQFLREGSAQISRRYAGTLLVNPDGHFILQRRDFAPGTYNPGRLSMFGGALEGAETPLECAVRELREETGMDVAESQLAFLTEATFTREDSSKTRCTIYFVSEVNPESVHVAEGLEYEIITDEQAVRDTSITPLCRTAILEYLKQR